MSPRRFVTFFALTAPALAAQAQTASLAEIQVRGSADYVSESSQAFTATRTDQSLMDVAQSVQVVGPSVLQEQQVRNLDDALSLVSGIAQAPTRAGTQDSFVRRGFTGSSSTGLLRDGVRSIQARNFSATTERIEVLKGPTSTLYGIQEPGGVINVVSKVPMLTSRTGLQLDTEQAGGYGAQFDTTGPITGTDWSYRLIASTEDRDDWRNFGRTRRDLLAPSLAWRSGGTEGVLAYEHTDYEVPFDDGTIFGANGRPIDIPRKRRLTESFSRMTGNTDFINTRLQHAFNSQWTARVNYAFNRNRYSDWRVRPNRYDDATGLLRRRADGRQNVDDSSNYLVADLVGKFRTGAVGHELLVGVDHERTLGRTGGELARITYNGFDTANPVYEQVPVPTAYDDTTRNARSFLRTTSLFAQDSVSLGERWIVSGSVRYQRWRQVEGAGLNYVETQNISGSEVLPRVGALYKLSPQVSLYANYATSFVPNLASSPAQAAFDPTKGRSMELGTKFQLSQRLSGTFALFDIEKKNIVVNLDDDTAQAIGKARSRGAELDMTGQVSAALRFIAAYAYTDTKVLEDASGLQGNRLPNAPKHSASIAAHFAPGWRTGDLPWHFNAAVRYAGERQGDAANSLTLPSYTVADLGLGTRFDWNGSTLHLDVLLRNAFDRAYYPSADGPLRVLVGAPRQLGVRLRATF
ncbi:TonB-dependent siderophore receptor [Xylophilus sp. GOD-11R]|uniref:TonB-dependent siderophore receptor n=1 Tax=Xylophilus sp. GOD-11R TaxID=3089814 RepID=UPI00298CD7C6|nr:TonB-dependent siderophore receptor [Xylophilus sp. GOD-11R]WPB58250.1 TonB-dependent siderophore receptor [Xylophilus sp. GOD-11R]